MTSDDATIEAAADALIEWATDQWLMIRAVRRRLVGVHDEPISPDMVVYWRPEWLRWR